MSTTPEMTVNEQPEAESRDPLIGVKALTEVYVGINRKCWGWKRVRGDEGRSNVYHVMSRTCGGEIFFDETEREALVLVMRKMARFCGIKILIRLGGTSWGTSCLLCRLCG